MQPQANYSFQKGSLTVPMADLEKLVSDSPEVLRLARQAEQNGRVAAAIGVAGLSAGLLGLILVPVGAALNRNPDGSLSTGSVATIGVGLGLLIVAIPLFVTGTVLLNNALGDCDRAVNMYNRQLLDGRLGP
jgi:hypothetical protein